MTLPKAIRTYSYERDTRSLRVVLQSGRHYVYRNVPADTFAAMANSRSKDEFYDRYVRGHFQFVRYPPVVAPDRFLHTPAAHEVQR
jgi:hypothetical protein